MGPPQGGVWTPVAASGRAFLVLFWGAGDARPWGGGDGEEGVPAWHQGRFLLRGGRFWLCRNHRSLQHGLGTAVLCWRGHTQLGLGCDRRPGRCAGTDLCPSPGAAAQSGKWVSPAGGITPKCPKIPLPLAGGRGGALSSSPLPAWPRARKG